jgi:hypothetical protein
MLFEGWPSKQVHKAFAHRRLGFLGSFDQNFNRMEPAKGFAKLLSEVVDATGQKYTANYLETWLQETGGYKNIRTQSIYVPVGWAGSSKYCKEPAAAGRFMLENAMVRCSGTARADAADVHILRRLSGPGNPCFCPGGCRRPK